MARKGLLVGPLIAALLVMACSGSSGSSDDPTPTTPPAVDVTPAEQITPPMEGPEPEPFAGNRERQNYRENPDFQQPDPESLPEPGDEQDGPEFHPPEEPDCPRDWEVLDRNTELFKICYPEGWQVDGHGYVTAGMDDRWYSVGIFKFLEDGSQAAHVSIYVMNTAFSRPPQLFIKTCEQAYQVKLDGHAAAVCPDVAAVRYPEARIVHYFIPIEERWIMINVVPYFEKDPETGAYTDQFSQADFEAALSIAHSISFYENPPGPGDIPAPIPFITPLASPTP